MQFILIDFKKRLPVALLRLFVFVLLTATALGQVGTHRCAPAWLNLSGTAEFVCACWFHNSRIWRHNYHHQR